MEFQYRNSFEHLSDKQIVERITAYPHDEEAAAFLLYNRYNPLLQSVYNSLTKDNTWFEDSVHELYIYLKGGDGNWHSLKTFEWRCSLGTWLKGVARNKMIDIIPKLIGLSNKSISIEKEEDEDGIPQKPEIQLPDNGEEEYERREQKVMLLEAISRLKDDDQKFVILKRLQGYNSKEIAILLQKKWKKHGIIKYNHNNEPVLPDAAYVDVRTQRAKENLKKIIIDL